MMDRETREMVESAVKRIAIARRTQEVVGQDVEEFDKELNDLCEKWHSVFNDMDALDLVAFMVADLEAEMIKGMGGRKDG